MEAQSGDACYVSSSSNRYFRRKTKNSLKLEDFRYRELAKRIIYVISDHEVKKIEKA